MATLMTVYAANGDCVGRCDERCYEARELVCQCVCNGRNHGVGLQQAVKTTVERADAMIGFYVEKTALDRGGYTATVFENDVKQCRLL
jgi:hypothetical protein